LILRLEGEMLAAARALEFEKAASLRDRMDEIRAALAMAERTGNSAALGAATEGANRRPVSAGREPRRMARRFGKDR